MLGSKKRWHLYFWSLVLFLFTTIAFVSLGWYGRKVVLDSNPCEMTYSTKAKTEVVINSYEGNYKLWKITNHASKKLSPYPVLFIPGHLGSDSQARSLASASHNEDGLLQFFAVNFNEEHVAFHGGDIITKASFVNMALQAIYDLYSRAKKTKDFRVTLIGHSYGGTIAKASLILSNHPQCVVKAIVMLGAPINRPPQSIDATSDLMIRGINRGWFHPHYNASIMNATVPTLHAPQDTNNAPVTADDSTPVCVRNVRIVSISGGVIDSHVLPEYSSMFEITPRPRNITVAPPSRVYTLNKFFEVKSWMTGLASSYVGAVKSILGMSSGNDTNSTVEMLPQETVRNVSGKYGFITQEGWERDIMRYWEPVHVALRTSQLANVGFPVDHYALVWCFDLLDSIHDGLRVLARKPQASMKMILEGFGVKDIDEIYKAVESSGAEGIDQLEEFSLREVMYERYIMANQEEWNYVLQKLGGNPVWLLATQYYTRHLSKIVTCYVALALFAFAGDILGRLCGYSMQGKSIPESGIMFHFVLLWHMFHRAFTTFGIPLSPDSAAFALLWIIIGVAIYNATAAVTHPTAMMIFWLVSFVLAYALLHIVAFSMRLLTRCGGFIADFFTWHLPFFRKRVNRMERKGPVLLRTLVPLMWEYAFELAFVVAVIVVSTLTQATSERSSASAYWFSVLAVSIFVGTAAMFVIFLNYNRDHLLWGERAAMMILSIPTILLALPAFEFSRQYLHPDNTSLHALSQAYVMLSAERLQYCIMVFIILLHLCRRSSTRELPEIERMQSLSNWTRDMFEQEIKPSKSPCLHEDGGECAVYQRVYREKNGSFHVGPSYKVIFCKCPSDSTLKSSDDWCEWCRCKRCSGHTHSTKPSKMSINLDLAMVVVLYIIAGAALHYGGEKLHVLLYCIGSVSLAVLLRSRHHGSEMEISMQGADLGTGY